MDIEQLNKAQIILLTLLVSFVTSIATGIVTVSLVNQAPQGITQTVNRIVERPVEKVVPSAPATVTLGQNTVTEKTVIVLDDDLAAQTIEKLQATLIRVIQKGSIDSAVIARGVIIDAAGIAITDKGVLDRNLSYEAILPSGKKAAMTLRPFSSFSAIAVIELTVPEGEKLQAVSLAEEGKLKLGQTVIRIGGKARDAVAIGTVSSLPYKNEGVGRYLEASVISATPGNILTTIFGDVVGITTVESLAFGDELYTPSAAARVVLSSAKKTAQ